jgi:hypothetical protein
MSGLRSEPNPLTRALKQQDSQIHGDMSQPVPKQLPLTWLIVAPRGGGKTSMLLSWLETVKGHFDTITLFSKTARNDAESKQVLRSLVDELDAEERFYTTLTEENAVETIERIQAYNDEWKQSKKKKKRQPMHLCIADDQLSSMPKGRYKSPINDLVVNQRHLKTTLVVLVQSFKSLPTIWRANAQLVSVWRTASKKEYQALEEDLAVDPERLRRVYEYATDEPRSFLHINLFDAAHPVFYKRFDRIIED